MLIGLELILVFFALPFLAGFGIGLLWLVFEAGWSRAKQWRKRL